MLPEHRTPRMLHRSVCLKYRRVDFSSDIKGKLLSLVNCFLFPALYSVVVSVMRWIYSTWQLWKSVSTAEAPCIKFPFHLVSDSLTNIFKGCPFSLLFSCALHFVLRKLYNTYFSSTAVVKLDICEKY